MNYLISYHYTLIGSFLSFFLFNLQIVTIKFVLQNLLISPPRDATDRNTDELLTINFMTFWITLLSENIIQVDCSH